MKIYRPDELGILYRSFRFARRNTLAVGMLGLFRFEDGAAGEPRPEPELWDAVNRAVGNAILDEGYPKPAGEFKVYGSAHALGGNPVREMLVSARVGAVSKQLAVSGDRHFNAVGLISSPEPFTSMPLTPQRAFGGEGVAANPVGKGACAAKLADGSEQWPLPNVESMRQRVLKRGDQVEPAGFWGFDAASPMRSSRLGRFDDNWLKHTWPHLPEDTSMEYFHAAPVDQRNSTYFKGDEAFELEGMHPRHAVQQFRLPGLRARCFINRRQADGSEKFSEAEARLDTVWLFPELECGIVLYRAQSDAADEDASDVLHVMAEWERLQDQPRSFEHYHQLFLSRLAEDRPGAQADSEPPVPEAPAEAAVQVPAPTVAVPAAAMAAVPAAIPEMTPEITEAYRQLDELERHTAELMRKNGLTEQDVARFLKAEAEEPAVSLAEAERMADDLEMQTRELMRKNNLTDADVMKFLPQAQEPEKPVSLAEVKGMIADLEKQTQDLLKKNGLTEADVEKVFESRPELAEALQNLREAKAADVPLSAIPDAFPALPKAEIPIPDAAAAAAVAMPSLPEGAPAHAQLTREQVIERHAGRQSLAGFDLSGVDLSGLDLSGADFSGSLMEKTVLTGSRLAGASLSGCLLQGADCSEADLSGADLADASAAGARFTKANLQAAQVTGADFTSADFSEAQLQKAVLDGASFEQATMAKIQATGSSGRQSNFSGADLAGADFGTAMLTQAMFNGAKLAAVNFKAAQCERAEFYGADASGAQFATAILSVSRADASSKFDNALFEQASLHRANWDGAQLAGASFAGANMDEADFSNVHAAGADFRKASARHTRFDKANLGKADLTDVNLFKGSLRKARVDDAVFHYANLHGVDFEGTTVRAAALQAADISRTILTFRPPKA